MARNYKCVCPFCGCYYDHRELAALYDEAEQGTLSKDELLAKMIEFRDRVLSEAGNAPVAAT